MANLIGFVMVDSTPSRYCLRETKNSHVIYTSSKKVVNLRNISTDAPGMVFPSDTLIREFTTTIHSQKYAVHRNAKSTIPDLHFCKNTSIVHISRSMMQECIAKIIVLFFTARHKAQRSTAGNSIKR